jgi:hypothetical protein
MAANLSCVHDRRRQFAPVELGASEAG